MTIHDGLTNEMQREQLLKQAAERISECLLAGPQEVRVVERQNKKPPEGGF